MTFEQALKTQQASKSDVENTIESVLRGLVPNFNAREFVALAKWAPDVFAVSGFLLHKTGLYLQSVRNEFFPKPKLTHPADLISSAKAWRGKMIAQKPPPPEILKLWRNVWHGKRLKLSQLSANKPLVVALFDLVAMADEACAGLGLPHPSVTAGDPEMVLFQRVEDRLNKQVTRNQPCSLCLRVDAQMICVLPRVRTPQTGISFRSMSHHLTLWPKDEVTPVWNLLPLQQSETDAERFNLLLIPYPHKIDRQQFKDCKVGRCGRHKMPDDYRCFSYSPGDSRLFIQKELPRLLKSARTKLLRKPTHDIHGVILPECALGSEEDFWRVYDQVQKEFPHAFVIAGVSTPGTRKRRGKEMLPGGNAAYFAAPVQGLADTAVYIRQFKHHRWQLESNQIRGYELKEFQETKRYWEFIELHPRRLNFFALKKWLTCTVLICEDLARQEPAARLVRSVGPNLLVALLLDGEQIEKRWPARYASILAEDPGSSVLSITSLGMAKLNPKAGRRKTSIALWRDSKGTWPIEIPRSARAMILSLQRDQLDEYSTDGRHKRASSLILGDKKDIIAV